MNNNILKKKLIMTALFLFAISIPANAASYKAAYRKVAKQLGYGDFSLVYIDGDKIPELVCTNSGGSFISIYTYKSGKAKCLTLDSPKDYPEMDSYGVHNSWKYGAGGFGASVYYYIPKKNKLYHMRSHKIQDTNKDPSIYGWTYKQVFTDFKIKNGRFELMKSITKEVQSEDYDKVFQPPKNYIVLKGTYSMMDILKKLY